MLISMQKYFIKPLLFHIKLQRALSLRATHRFFSSFGDVRASSITRLPRADLDLITMLQPHLLIHMVRSRFSAAQDPRHSRDSFRCVSFDQLSSICRSEAQLLELCSDVFKKLRAGGKEPATMIFSDLLASCIQQIDSEVIDFLDLKRNH